MTTQWSTTVSQIQQFLEQHLPTNVTGHAGLGAAAAIAIGIVLCVLGAKLARVAFTAGWAVGGAFLGIRVAEAAGIHPLVGALLFAAGLGMIGHLTYRMCVGVVTAAVITAMVLSAFGYHRVAPRLAEYNLQATTPLLMTQPEGAGASADPAVFTIPSQQEQLAYRDGAFKQNVEQFWSYVQSQDQTILPHTSALAATALVFGLLVGLSTVRLTLIFSTALIGTAMLGSGIVGIINHVFPGFAGGAAQHPLVGVIALGLCLVVSVFLQARLTRPSKEGTESGEKSAKADAPRSPGRKALA